VVRYTLAPTHLEEEQVDVTVEKHLVERIEMDKPKLFSEQMNNDTYNVLTNEQLHTLTKVMSGLGAPNEIDDTGWCKDTWTEGNDLADKPSLNDVDAERAAYILYKFADTQLPTIGSNNGFDVDSKIMWATRQSHKLSIIRYADNFGNRIALMGWFNGDCNKELREQLKWPKCQWVTNDKIDGWPDGNEATGAWTIQDDPDVISVALDVLNKYGFNFTNLISVKDNTTIIVSTPVEDTKIDKRYKAVLNIDAVELHWPFLKNNNDIRSAIKKVDGWKWDADAKCWRVPLSQAGQVADFVRPHSKELADAILRIPEVSSYIDNSMDRVMLSQATEAPEDLVDGIKERLDGKFPDGCELFPFQYVGVAFVEAANGRAMIGDEMGIGKTIQAIAYSVLHTEQWPVLVVCPANVKYNWGNELAKWVPDASVCVVKNGKSDLEGADYTVINYDLMAKRKDELLAEGYNLVILDESHYIKNEKAQRTITTVEVARQSKGLICLTGTPITNRPKEWYSNLNLLRPAQFSNFFSYGKRYCNGFKGKFGWNFDGSSNLPELNEKARDFMVRRLLEEVIPEMPSLIESFISVELDASALRDYREVVAGWQEQYEYYLDNKPMPAGFVLNMLTELRHECGRLKIAAAAEYIAQYNDTTGKQIVVFAHHRDVLDGIANQIDAAKQYVDMSYSIIRGGVSAQERTRIVEEFQNGDIDVLLCATIAAKEGITLTNADTVLFVEREWVPGWESQAAHRIRRIGQESSHCHQVFLSVDGSIDQHFDAVIRGKQSVVTAALDGDTERRAEGAIVSDLLKKLIEDNNWRNE
tara:strand:- start:2252 stop:4690 length:2439 start_codon:yes stop_codon:yes gene_type:complete